MNLDNSSNPEFGYTGPMEVNKTAFTSSYNGEDPSFDWMGVLGGVANLADTTAKLKVKEEKANMLDKTAIKAQMRAAHEQMTQSDAYITADADKKVQFELDFQNQYSNKYKESPVLAGYATDLTHNNITSNKEEVVADTEAKVASAAIPLYETWLQEDSGVEAVDENGNKVKIPNKSVKTPDDFVEFLKKAYPGINPNHIKDAMVAQIYDKGIEGLDDIKSLKDLKAYEESFREYQKQFRTDKFLSNKNAAYSKYVKDMETKFKLERDKKIAEIKDTAKATLVDVTNTLKGDVYVVPTPTEDKQAYEIAATAYYGNEAGYEKWKAQYEADKKSNKLRTYAVSVNTPGEAKKEVAINKEAKELWEVKVKDAVLEKLKMKDARGAADILTVEGNYLTETKRVFGDMLNNVKTIEEYDNIVVPLIELTHMDRYSGSKAVKNLVGKDGFKDIIAISSISKTITANEDNPLQAARDYVEQSKTYQHAMDPDNKEEAYKIRASLPPRLGNEFFHAAQMLANNNVLTSDTLSKLETYFTGLKEEINDGRTTLGLGGKDVQLDKSLDSTDLFNRNIVGTDLSISMDVLSSYVPEDQWDNVKYIKGQNKDTVTVYDSMNKPIYTLSSKDMVNAVATAKERAKVISNTTTNKLKRATTSAIGLIIGNPDTISQPGIKAAKEAVKFAMDEIGGNKATPEQKKAAAGVVHDTIKVEGVKKVIANASSILNASKDPETGALEIKEGLMQTVKAMGITVPHVYDVKVPAMAKRDVKKVMYAIIHRTAGNDINGNPLGDRMVKDGIGAAIYMDRDGSLLFPNSGKVGSSHISPSKSYDKYKGKVYNTNSIGIEIVGLHRDQKEVDSKYKSKWLKKNPGKKGWWETQEWEPLTKKQEEVLKAYGVYLNKVLGISDENILAHGDTSSNRHTTEGQLAKHLVRGAV